MFDSSVAGGEPAEFPVNGVIPGWIEALTLMPVGSKWELTIPQELAYGERGAGASIPPFSTLAFEVELLEILEQRICSPRTRGEQAFSNKPFSLPNGAILCCKDPVSVYFVSCFALSP